MIAALPRPMPEATTMDSVAWLDRLIGFPTVSRDRHPPARQATRPTAQQLRLL